MKTMTKMTTKIVKAKTQTQTTNLGVKMSLIPKQIQTVAILQRNENVEFFSPKHRHMSLSGDFGNKDISQHQNENTWLASSG